MKQVQGYIEFIKENLSDFFGKEYSIDQFDVQGVLLFHSPIPVPLNKPKDITITDIYTLKKLLVEKSLKASAVLRKAQNHTPDNTDSTKFRFIPESTIVGQWTFTRHVYANYESV